MREQRRRSRGLASRAAGRRAAPGLGWAALWLGLACAPLPLETGPGLAGRVVDAASGRPVAGAVVLAASWSRYDEALPERRLLGYREAVTARDGSFRLPPLRARGLGAWPWLRLDEQVVAVLAPGHRCAPLGRRPGAAMAAERLRIELEPLAPGDDALADCPLLPPQTLERVPHYAEAWKRARAASGAGAALTAPGPPLDRLRARRAFGFGENCWGPVIGFRLSQDGAAVTYVVEERGESKAATLALAEEEARAAAAGLWSPRFVRVVPGTDPASGAPLDRLEVLASNGRIHAFALPGERCRATHEPAPAARRLAAGGHLFVDLRFLRGGCHLLAVNVDSGRSRLLDPSREPARCREGRRLPAFHLWRALPVYARELAQRMRASELDPSAPFVITIDAAGRTRVLAHDREGLARRVAIPRFPLPTPLHRIRISPAGLAASPAPEQRAAPWEPL